MNNIETLSGTWISKSTENLGNNTFGFREFDFDGNKWEVRFTLFLDKEGTIPVIVLRANGEFVIQEKSKVVDGANNALFYFSRRFVTLKTDNEEIIKNFGFIGLGLKKDEEKDISETGASFLPSVKNYPQEYDLIKISDDNLFLGMRSEDMRTEDKRPTELFYPLIKK